MITWQGIKKWVKRQLEEPFCHAELARVEVLRSERNAPTRKTVLAVVAGSNFKQLRHT